MSEGTSHQTRDFLSYDKVEENAWTDGSLELHKVFDDFDKNPQKSVKIKKGQVEFHSLFMRKPHTNIIFMEEYLHKSMMCVEYFSMHLKELASKNPSYLFDCSGKLTNHFVRNIRGLINALNFLHKEGIIHGNIKAENILCGKDKSLQLRFIIENLEGKVKENEKTQKIIYDWKCFGTTFEDIEMEVRCSNNGDIDPEYKNFYSILTQSNLTIESIYELVYNHPLFWSTEEKMVFFIFFVDTMNSSSGADKNFIESHGDKSRIFPKGVAPWDTNIHQQLFTHQCQFGQYNTHSVCSYLKFGRNRIQHANVLPRGLKNSFGGSREDIFQYFSDLNQNLIMELCRLARLLKWNLTACNFLTDRFHIEL